MRLTLGRRGGGAMRRAGGLAGLALGFALHAEAALAGQQCKPSTVVKGADLDPDGDGTLDWGSSGLGFAIIKATQGDYYTDSDFTDNWAALKTAGVVRGAYHFFDATVSGAEQASYFLDAVGTFEPGDLPPVLDIECPVSGEDDCLGDGSSGYATGAEITQVMNDFLRAVKAATGVTPIVYSYGSWFSDNGVDTTGLQNYPLWLADVSYTNCFNVPDPWTTATIWQYDTTGTVSGQNVDDDYFLGSMAQLTAFTHMGGTPYDAGAPDDDAGPGEDAGGVGDPCTVTDTGDTGTCLDVSTCMAMNGTSTPGFCPGSEDVQCCTGVATSTSSSSHATSSSHHGSQASSASSVEGSQPASTAGSTGEPSAGGGPDAGTTGASTSSSSVGIVIEADAGSRGADAAGVKIPGKPGSASSGGAAGGDAEADAGGEGDSPGSGGGCAVGGRGSRAEGLSAAALSALAAAFASGRRRRRVARSAPGTT